MTEIVDRVAWAINAAWNECAEVPFPLYQHEAEALAKAAIEAMRQETPSTLTVGKSE